MHWKRSSSSRKKRSSSKVMFIVFFIYVKSVILKEQVPGGTTVSQHYYKEDLKKLRCQKNHQNHEKQLILHQYNVFAYTAVSVKNVIADTLLHWNTVSIHQSWEYQTSLFLNLTSILKREENGKCVKTANRNLSAPCIGM